MKDWRKIDEAAKWIAAGAIVVLAGVGFVSYIQNH